MILRIKNTILDFSKSDKTHPIVFGFAVGLYPMLYYYDQNFSLVNSLSQLGMFVLTFILIPIVYSFLIQKTVRIFPNFNILKFCPSAFNFAYFLSLVVICTLGIKLKIIATTILFGAFFGILLYKNLNKVIVFQLLLVLIISPKLILNILYQIDNKTSWQKLPDKIVNSKFNKFPNIYVVQPDGYTNFSELRKGYYNFDNKDFEEYLGNSGFKTYVNFRSNYFSTLSSNSSMFSMKHHFYNNPKQGANEVYNSRNIIVGENAVVKTFKNNGYKTNLLLEKSYLLVNRPILGFDYCNVDKSEVSFLARGFETQKNIIEDLKGCMKNNEKQPNFYFIQKLKPGHINNQKNLSLGSEKERDIYLSKIQEANVWLINIIKLLEEKDPHALVIIVADHGGFVGFDYTMQSKIKQTDPDLLRSIFTVALAIKWPDGAEPDFDSQLKTNVNLFRILITHLSGDNSLLKNLELDKSYIVIDEGAPFGVYEYINEKDEIVFKKYSTINKGGVH